jgi:hypothetical protein
LLEPVEECEMSGTEASETELPVPGSTPIITKNFVDRETCDVKWQLTQAWIDLFMDI